MTPIGNTSLSHQNPLLTDLESSGFDAPVAEDNPDSMNVGLDWLNIAFDMHPDLSDLESDVWSSTPNGGERLAGVAYQELFARLKFGKTNVSVTLNLIRFRCYARFNPSKALFGNSMQLVSGDDAWLVVQRLLEFLQPHVYATFDYYSQDGLLLRDSDWLERVWLTRVDCARNLYIDEPEQFKKLATTSIGKHNPIKSSYSKERGTWGLVHKTKQEGQDRIYDKSLELSQYLREEEVSEIEPNWFRFETQLQRDRLIRYNMTRLSDLQQERVWVALEQRFAATGWGVAIRDKGDLSSVLSPLSPTDKMSLLGFIAMHRLGIQNEVTPGRQRKYQRLMLSLGLTLDDPVDLGPVRGVVDIRLGKIADRSKGGGSSGERRLSTQVAGGSLSAKAEQ